MFNSKTAGLLALASTSAAHFFLQDPPTIGFEDSTMEEGPCGGFEPSLRDGPITDWPVNGHSVSLISTHQDVVWHVDAALLSDPANFVPIVQPFRQTGVGEICFETVPGKPSWVGEDVVISIYQITNHGNLYQCVAARFVEGPAAEVPSACVNFPGVEIDDIVAAPDHDDDDGDDDDSTTTTEVTTAPTATTSTPDPEPTSDDHDHGSAAPTPSGGPDDGDDGDDNDHDHSHGDEDDDDHGEDHGDEEEDHDHGHNHGDDTPSPSANGTAPEPSGVEEAGADKQAMAVMPYIAAAGVAAAMVLV